MHPLALQASARHRREPTVRQQVRGSIAILAALALIAAFGIFGASLLGGESFQADLLDAVPLPVRVFGWITYALPLAAIFGLLVPTPWRFLRIGVSLLVLAPGAFLMIAMSKPRGVDPSQWAIDPAFAHAQSVTSYALLISLFAWAMVAAVILAVGQPARLEDRLLKLRCQVLWVGPVTLGVSLVSALVF
jgi:hypothetical protein